MHVAGAALPMKQVVDIDLPGAANRFDYQSLDPRTHRLYIAHLAASSVVVFDTAANKVVADIQQIIRTLKGRGIGILITDHNVRETLGICDYAYIMKDGKVQVEGVSEEITNNELARKFYLGENFKL